MPAGICAYIHVYIQEYIHIICMYIHTSSCVLALHCRQVHNDSWVRSMVFTPDNTLISGGDDSHISIMSMEPGMYKKSALFHLQLILLIVFISGFGGIDLLSLNLLVFILLS